MAQDDVARSEIDWDRVFAACSKAAAMFAATMQEARAAVDEALGAMREFWLRHGEELRRYAFYVRLRRLLPRRLAVWVAAHWPERWL